MTKLRVGDIEIDGRRVTIHQGQQLPVAGGATGRSLDEGTIRVLRRLPVSSRTLVIAGSIVFITGLILILTALPDISSWGLLSGGISASIGIGLLGAGVAKHVVVRRPQWTHRAALGPDADEYLKKLLSLLAEDHAHQTVPWIMKKTGWSESQVVHALALLIARDRVMEMKDPDNADFYYVSTAAFLPRDLDSRLNNLTP